MRTQEMRRGTTKFDPLLFAFTLTMAASTYSQPIAAPSTAMQQNAGSQAPIFMTPSRLPLIATSPTITLASPPVAVHNTSPLTPGKAPVTPPFLSPDMAAFHHTAPPSPFSFAGSPERSPLAAPALVPSPATKQSTPAPSLPHPLATHRPVTPPSHPSTIPDRPYSRPPPSPYSSDSLPPDTSDTLPPPPPPPRPPFVSFPAIPPPAGSTFTPAASTLINDPSSESKSVLNKRAITGIAIGGILAAALVGMVAFVVGKRKANIARAQYGHAVYREQL
ncbi:hypothetical protein O6H91_18G044000 [Diphasiastrum complanatum]|uniref:Uncharacterized protein n=1 Tax=Diphasiastrum complanatum TaxID=34168 RepID=A0ACC2B0H0_DIPCM|nr:hypothetical protein O6H91_18G044000 [Diphasiastrum complanatum]